MHTIRSDAQGVVCDQQPINRGLRVNQRGAVRVGQPPHSTLIGSQGLAERSIVPVLDDERGKQEQAALGTLRAAGTR